MRRRRLNSSVIVPFVNVVKTMIRRVKVDRDL